ncbi:BT_3044 domain-containing protein [Gaoshiqia sp. Z1-71]|uniref:BT_3044 domain-containing protein n=1 Tax=Gaoshiqia hydrogeniformans TaxID=3290090 RepID=UPI003BF86D4C
MKKIILFSLSLAMLFVGCEKEDSPMDRELFPQKVYIVGARDQIINRDIDLGKSTDTISVSVAVSGSLPLSKDVTVTFAENPDEITLYNERNVSGADVQYQKLDDAIYSYPLNQVTINAGQVYNTYPIHINPATLQYDSLYMIPLRLSSISDYELSDNDTTVLVRLNLMNQYSGLYYVKGILKNTTNPNDSVFYRMSRNLVATDNGNTVRMYHFNNETKDYRPSHTFKITVNSDNSLSYATWDQFVIYDGGGTYHPDVKVYDFWYEYNNNGTRWRAEGILYLERKTNEEQDILDDWLDDHGK